MARGKPFTKTTSNFHRLTFAFQVQPVILVVLYLGFIVPWIQMEKQGSIDDLLTVFNVSKCSGVSRYIRCPRFSRVSIISTTPSDQCPGGRFTATQDLSCAYNNSKEILSNICENRQKCKVNADLPTIQSAHCPHVFKNLDISYQCRPKDFKTSTTCQDRVFKLKCRGHSRIVIYRAKFGRSREMANKCSVNDYIVDCGFTSSTDKVRSRCHGRKQCKFVVSTRVFGQRCGPPVPAYLTVTHRCIHKKVIKAMQKVNGERSFSPRHWKHTRSHISTVYPHINPVPGGATKYFVKLDFQSSSLPTTSISSTFLKPTFTHDNSYNTKYRVKKQESTRGHGIELKNDSPLDRGYRFQVSRTNTTPHQFHILQKHRMGYITDWMTVVNYVQKNSEKVVLYMCVGALSGAVLMLLLVIVKLAIDRKRKSHAKLDISEPPYAGHNHARTMDGASLERSESAADMIEVVRFSPRGTLRSERAGPVSLHNDSTSRSLNNYYYG